MGNYDQFVPKTQMEKFGNILTRAAGVIKNDVMPQQNQNPFMQGIQSTMQGLKTTPGLGPYMMGHDIKSDMAQNLSGGNPVIGAALDIGSDPETLMGLGGAVKGAVKGIAGAGKTAKSLMNPIQAASKLEGGIEGAMSKAKNTYGAGLSEIESQHSPQYWIEDPYAPKTVSFADELGNPKTLAEQKIFNSVRDEAAFQGMDINKLSPEESKNVMDIFKNKVGQHVVAGEVGPTEINQTATLGNLKARQLEAFPEFAGIDAPYGPKADAYKAVSGKAPNILEGGGNRIMKQKQLENLKTLDPKLYSTAKNYRQGNAILKSVKNPLVQGAAAGAAGVPIVGGLLKAIFHEH